PQDLVRADIVGQRPDRALDRLEGDPAVALEQLARPGLEAGIVEPLVVEMTVHAVEPGRHPAAARLQEADPELGMAFADAAPDHAHAGQHHLHGVRDDVLRAAALEAVDAHGRHAAVAALVDADAEVEVLRLGPERLVLGRVQLTLVVGIGPQEAAAEAEHAAGKAHLLHRRLAPPPRPPGQPPHP